MKLKGSLVKINFLIERANYTDCKKDPKYHTQFMNGNIWHLSYGSTAVQIEFGDYTQSYAKIYCKSCADQMYKELSPVLNTKLWAFI